MRKVCYSCSFVIFFVPESLFMIVIPSIVAENMPETPPMSSSDIASARLESSPTLSDSRYRDLDNSRSMSVDLWSGVTVRLQSIYPSRFLVFCCRRTSSMEDEPENVANAMHAMVNFQIWQLQS